MGRDSPGLACAWKEKDEGTGGVPELSASENSCGGVCWLLGGIRTSSGGWKAAKQSCAEGIPAARLCKASTSEYRPWDCTVSFNPISDWAVQPLVNLHHKNYSSIKPCAVCFMVDEWSCRNLLWELIGGFYVARAAGASTVSVWHVHHSCCHAAAFGENSCRSFPTSSETPWDDLLGCAAHSVSLSPH